jgi:hypothetical protein
MDVEDLSPNFKSTDPLADLPEGDGVLILSPYSRILSANLQAERLLQVKLNRGQTLPLELLVSKKYLSQAELAFRNALKTGSSTSNLIAQVNLTPDDTRGYPNPPG